MKLDIKYKQLKGLKGLTVEDRKSWEQDNLTELRKTTYFNSSEEDKDKFYSGYLAKANLEDLEQYDEILARAKIGQIDPVKIYNDIMATDWADEKALSAQQAVIQNPEEHLIKDPEVAAFHALAQKNSAYYREFITQHKYDFGNFSLGKEYIDLENKAVTEPLIRQYKADVVLYGQENADAILDSRVQDIVADQQGFGESIFRASKGFSNYMAAGLLGTVGILEGISRLVTNGFYYQLPDAVNEALGNTPLENAQDLITPFYKNTANTWANELLEQGDKYTRIALDSESMSGSLADELLQWKTLAIIAQQAGFAASAIISGRAVTSLIKGLFNVPKMFATAATVGKVPQAKEAFNLLKMQKLNEYLQSIASVESKAVGGLTTAIVGSGEGALNAMETRNATIENLYPAVEEKIQEYKENLYSRNIDLARTLEGKQHLDMLVENYKNKLTSEMYDTADSAGATDFMFNAVINSSILSTLQKGILGTDYVKASYAYTKAKEIFSPKKLIINDAGDLVSKGTPIWKKTVKTIGEPAGEFIQESLQTISSGISQGYYDSQFNKYLNMKYNTEANEMLSYDIAELQAMYEAEKNIQDPNSMFKYLNGREILHSGIMGLLGSTIGTIAPGKNFLPTYRNPLVSKWKEITEEDNDYAKSLEYFNKWLSIDNNKEKFTKVATSLAWAKDIYEAEQSGDSFRYETSKLGKTISDFYLLSQIKGTKYYDSLMQTFDNVLSAEEGSEQAKLLEQEAGEEANIEDIKKSVRYMLDIHSKVEETGVDIEKALGKDIPTNIKEQLVFGSIMYKDFDRRLDDIEKQLSGISFKRAKNVEATGISDAAKKQIALNGTLDTKFDILEEKIEKEKQKVKDFERRFKAVSKSKQANTIKEYNQTKKNLARLERQLNSLKEAKAEISREYTREDGKIKTPVLSIMDIMSLNAEDRAYMLDPKNFFQYSASQRKVINTIKQAGNLHTANFNSLIENSGKIYSTMEEHLELYNELLRNPEKLDLAEREAKRMHENQMLAARAKALNKITSEEEFLRQYKSLEDEVEKSMGDTTLLRKTILIAEKRALISRSLKNNPFYQKYEKQKSFYSKLGKTIEDKIDNISSKHLAPFIADYLQKNGVDISNSNNIYNALNETDASGAVKLYTHLKKLLSQIQSDIKDEEILQAINDFKTAVDQQVINSLELDKFNNTIEVPTTQSPSTDSSRDILASLQTEEPTEKQEQSKSESKKEDNLGEGRNTSYFIPIHISGPEFWGEEIWNLWNETWKVPNYLESISEDGIKETIFYIPATEDVEELFKKHKQDYNKEEDFPIILVVKKAQGPIAGGYQPIGLLPSSKKDSVTNSKVANELRKQIIQNLDKTTRGVPFKLRNNIITSKSALYGPVRLSNNKEADTNSLEFLDNSAKDVGLSVEGRVLDANYRLDIAGQIARSIKVIEEKGTKRMVFGKSNIRIMPENVLETPSKTSKENTTFKEILEKDNPDSIVNFNYKTKEILSKIKDAISLFNSGNINSSKIAIKDVLNRIYNKNLIVEIEELQKEGTTVGLSIKITDILNAEASPSIISFDISENGKNEEKILEFAAKYIKAISNESSSWQFDFTKDDNALKNDIKNGILQGLVRFPISSMSEINRVSSVSNPDLHIEEERKEFVVSSGNEVSTSGPITTKADGTIVNIDTGEIVQKSTEKISSIKEEVTQVVDKILEDSKNIKLSDDGSKYEDVKKSRTYKRVTNVISEAEDSTLSSAEEVSLKTVSTTYGNEIDEFVRFLFEQNADITLKNNSIYYKNSKGEEVKYESKNIPPSELEKIANVLGTYKNALVNNGWHVIPNGVTLTGKINIKDNDNNFTEIDIAGTLDLLVYNDSGEFMIIDVKTVNGDGLSSDKKGRYSNQVSLYKLLLSEKYGIDANSISTGLLVIPLAYSTIGKYSLDSNGKLKYSLKGKESNPELKVKMNNTTFKVQKVNEKSKEELEEIIQSFQSTEIKKAVPLNTEVIEVTIAEEASENALDIFDQSDLFSDELSEDLKVQRESKKLQEENKRCKD